jgi:hypothetical protein
MKLYKIDPKLLNVLNVTKQKVEDFNKCKHNCTTKKWPHGTQE